MDDGREEGKKTEIRCVRKVKDWEGSGNGPSRISVMVGVAEKTQTPWRVEGGEEGWGGWGGILAEQSHRRGSGRHERPVVTALESGSA